MSKMIDNIQKKLDNESKSFRNSKTKYSSYTKNYLLNYMLSYVLVIPALYVVSYYILSVELGLIFFSSLIVFLYLFLN
ncbi:MAG: hypothetical protein N2169_03405 [bacterium]|nr:hypothetical protein [bacterium]